MAATTWFRLLGLSCLLLAALFAATALTQDAKKGKMYALLVGVKVYDHRKLTDLKYTENDAEELARVLRQGGYDEVVVLTTSRGEKDGKATPTRANIERELKRLLDKVTKRDVILIGLAGHGVQYEVKLDGKKKDESFFCPSDARLVDTDDFKELARTMLPFRELFKRLDDSGAGSRFLLVDACRNDPGSARNADTDAMPAVTRGTAALFACKGGERAFESDKLGKGHGIFFYNVIQALKGDAKSEEGEVTWDDLTRYVRRNVVKAVREHVKGGAKQTPELMARLEGDPVLLRPVVETAEGRLDRDGKNSIGMRFKLIRKGTFTMGSGKGDQEALPAEKPEREVGITKAFYLGAFEVTQKQYKDVMGYNPSYFSKDGKGDGSEYRFAQPAGGKEKVKDIDDENLAEFPVDNISHLDAMAFVKKLNEKEKKSLRGWKYSLPTEAQWEYACRGGVASKKFHFGDSLSDKNANFSASKLGRTSKVGSYRPNAFGLYDMHGNVWEWCLDHYNYADYANTPKLDPLCLDGDFRVGRGGSWDAAAWSCRTAHRGYNHPDFRHFSMGFRVALIPAR